MQKPVNYRKEMVTVGDFGGNIWRILCRWQGSVYKLVWVDLLAWLGLYFTISIIYRFLLDALNKARFASFVKHCDGFMNMIPLSWVLGFFVGMVVKRWWEQFQAIPWPDTISYYVYTAFPEQDESSRVMRRTIVRWVNLTITMVLLKMIEPSKHLETKDDYIQDGLMTQSEKMILEDFERKTSKCRVLDHKDKTKTKCNNEASFIWPIPLTWALNLVRKARKEKKIEFDKLAEILVNELVKLRAQCGGLLAFDWINVPLVYTQVVTIALYSYFFICLLARQFIPAPDPLDEPTVQVDGQLAVDAYTKWSMSGGKTVFDKVDYFIPIFTILQFVFYVGWLKVAESLMNPFGNDDDDFDILFLLKRNKEAAYLIVDEMGVNPPEAQTDMFWNREIPKFCSKDKDPMPPVQDVGGPPRTPDMRHPGMAPPQRGAMQPPMPMAPMGSPRMPGGPHGGPPGAMMHGIRPPMNPPRLPQGGHPGDDQQPLYQNF